MKTHILALATGFLILLAIILYVTKTNQANGAASLKVGQTTFQLELADTESERVQGLSDRKLLEEESGMLFLFPNKSIQAFWMKDMHFPLDIIWIDEDTIVGYEENAKPEGESPTEKYFSPKPINKVLEVNAGVVKKLNLKIGQKLNLENIN